MPRRRAELLASVEEGRCAARAHWNFAPDAELTHDQAAAIDRRAVRDALVKHDLLIIYPRRPRGRAGPRRPPPDTASQRTPAAGARAQSSAAPQEVRAASVHTHSSAGTIGATQQEMAPPTVGRAVDLRQRVLALVPLPVSRRPIPPLMISQPAARINDWVHTTGKCCERERHGFLCFRTRLNWQDKDGGWTKWGKQGAGNQQLEGWAVGDKAGIAAAVIAASKDAVKAFSCP
jgi:hypothetical protein